MKLLKCQIAQIGNVVTNNGTINNSITVNNQNVINVNINSFLKEDTNYISSEFVMNCAKRLNNGLIDFIKTIRFNPEHPENMNVKIHRIKQKTLYVYKQNRWEICDAKWTLEEMIVHGARILHQQILTECDQDKLLDEDSSESRMNTWLLSLLPRTNEKMMGMLSRRLYAVILDNQLLLMEQSNETDMELNVSEVVQ